jgi:hypothetical protein
MCMKGFHRNTEGRVHEGDEVVPACQDEARLEGYLPACVHHSLLLEYAQSWKCDESALGLL